MRLTNLFTLLLALLLCTNTFAGSDLAKEKRWTDQIVDALLDGEPLMLNDGKNEFLTIITEADEPRSAGLIIMHGTGIHPDYPSVVNPLRVGLAERGWTTLSLQLPVLPNEAEDKAYIPLIPEAAPRVRAGVEHLKSAGFKKVIVIAHSLGTEMAGHALADNSKDVNGFVAIGMGPDGVKYLSRINMPIFDLYGENDLPGVVSTAQRRKTVTANNSDFTQVKTKEADHFFNDQEDALLEAVSQWLTKRSF